MRRPAVSCLPPTWPARACTTWTRAAGHRCCSYHRTVMLDGAGHYIQEDAAEEIIAAIRNWSAARRG